MTKTITLRKLLVLTAAASVSLAFQICGDDPSDVVEDAPSPWDTDGDGISDSVETNTQNDFHNFLINFPDSNRSRALGFYDGGVLDWGINLPDTGTGYYHYIGGDPKDSDDWGTLALINTIEQAGRQYAAQACSDSATAGAIPMQSGDMSLRYGGLWQPDHPGGTHQNGTEVDVRYLRNDGMDGLDLSDLFLRTNVYDRAATRHLIQCYLNDPAVIKIFYDSIYTEFDPPFPGSVMDHDGDREHADHFHVRIADPDGENN